MYEMLASHWPNLLTIYIACLAAFISPGPNFVAIASHAVNQRHDGVAIAIGISFGTAIWALLAVTGITTLLSAYEDATLIVGFAGGSYLCWLGVKSIRSVLTGTKFSADFSHAPHQATTFLRSVATGLLIQMTNPKTALFWLALTSLAIKPHTPQLIIFVMVLGCLVIALAWHIVLALAFSAESVRQKYISFKSIFSAVFGTLFIGFGLKVIYSAINGK